MKREYQEKMETLARREEEAKKQVQFFFYFKFISYFFFTIGCHLGTNVSRMDGNYGKTC
jgi:hypothetical protein